MATYHAGRFWDLKEVQEVTVRADISVDRYQWVHDMKDWAESHGMDIKWQGESTHTEGDNSWHQAHFLIAGEANRTMFMLAWNR